MEKSIRYTIDNPMDSCETDSTARKVLPIMKPIVELLNRECYADIGVSIGGGVRERDTGYERFSAHYESFSECEKNLVSDYQSSERLLKGTWYDFLNYEYIEVSFKSGSSRAILIYMHGVLALTGDEETLDKIQPEVDRIVAPHIWKDIN